VFENAAVRQSFLNVLIFLVINVPLTVVLSLLVATALNAAIPFRTFFGPHLRALRDRERGDGRVWLFMFSTTGIINKILGPLAPVPSWLINQNWAMPSIAIYVSWKSLGFFILLYLAAWQNVPKELYEAASIDGRRGGIDSSRSRYRGSAPPPR